MDKVKVKKIGNILLNVLLAVFLTIAVLSVFLTFFSKKDIDGAADIFGHQLRVVTSDSMGASEHTDVSQYKIKEIPVRSLILIRNKPTDPVKLDEWYRSLQVGDVLTFRYVYSQQVTITHRVVSVTEKDTGGFLIELAGDNKSSTTSQLNQIIDTSIPNNMNYVIGKVVGTSYWIGFLMSHLMQPIAIVLAIIVPCAVIIILEMVKITKAFMRDETEREKQKNVKKDMELEELRRKLAALEQGSADAGESLKTEDNLVGKEEETK